MTVRTRHAISAVALAVVFGGGWASGRSCRAPVSAVPTARPDQGQVAGAATEVSACTDRLAMEANANLVGQVQDYRGRLALAQSHAVEAERKVDAVAHAPPARLITSPEEWARMAREGTLRVRTPCSRWNASGRFILRSAGRTTTTGSSSRSFETNRRAEAAGLYSEEQEALGEVYARAHARTWAAMRGACESNAGFREAIAELEEPTDQLRSTLCWNHVLDMSEASTKPALRRVAELRAAGAGIERAATDEQRVAFAATNAPSALFDEMVKALGSEKATRAIDNGVLCLDESLLDLREPTPEPG